MLKQDLKEKAIQLSDNGISYGKIAEQLGVGKTTVYNWINSTTEINEEKTVPERQTNVPNSFKNDLNELGDYKEELQNEYEIENDVSSLVALKKAEMDHELKMERIELERERMLFEQKQVAELKKTEQLALQLEKAKVELEQERKKMERVNIAINQMEQKNKVQFNKIDVNSSKKKELDDNLQTVYTNQIKSYLELEGREVTIEKIDFVLGEVKLALKNIKHWIKETRGKITDYPEFSTLKQIKDSLIEMVYEFDDSGEDILVFDFDSEFELKLKSDDHD